MTLVLGVTSASKYPDVTVIVTERWGRRERRDVKMMLARSCAVAPPLKPQGIRDDSTWAEILTVTWPLVGVPRLSLE